MKRARFTKEQIIGVLREHEAGAKTADLARKQGVSEATLYNWKAKYGGMDVPKVICHQSRRPKEIELRARLSDLANARRWFGYRRLLILLRQEGEPSGINARIYRLCREEGLAAPKRRARRRAVGTRAPILVEARTNARWSLDFVHNQFASGQRFRILNVVDDVTRECLAAIPDTSIFGRRVARELSDLIERRGKPGLVVSDNGTEFLLRRACLGAGGRHRLAFHRARQTHAERILRELQRPHARRTSQREPVLRPRPRPHEDQ
jgi:transposase InsO family protein